jgi:hypothetical protein
MEDQDAGLHDMAAQQAAAERFQPGLEVRRSCRDRINQWRVDSISGLFVSQQQQRSRSASGWILRGKDGIANVFCFNRARLSAKRPRATPSPRNTPKPTRYMSKRPLFVSLLPLRPPPRCSQMRNCEHGGKACWTETKRQQSHRNQEETQEDE